MTSILASSIVVAMATVQLLPAESCLLTAIAEALAASGSRQLQEITVVLPTGRLGTMLRAALAARLGALMPPRMLTFDGFLTQSLGGLAHLSMDDTTIDLVLARLFETLKTVHLLSGHERELRHFFNEIHEHGLGMAAFDRLEAELAQDCYKSQGHLGSLHHRFAEMRRVYTEMQKILEQRGAYIRGEKQARDAATLLSHWQELGPKAGKRLVIAGFTSLVSSWRPLWQELGESADVEFWLSMPPSNQPSPLRELISLLPEPKSFLAKTTAAARPCRVGVAHDRRAEVQAAIAVAQGWIAQGLKPSAVAILVSDEGAYGPLLRELVPGLNIRANLAIASPLSQAKLGLWLAMLRQLSTQRQDGAALTLWLLDPLTLKLLSRELEGHNQAEVRGLLFSILERYGHGGLDQLLAVPLEWALWHKLKPRIVSLLQPIMSRRQALASWLQDLAAVLQQALACEPPGALRASLEEAIEQLLAGLAELALLLPGPGDGASFLKLVVRRLETIDLRAVGEPLHGLQILGLPEARYVPFQAAILLGMNEGSFPKALPQDALIDDYLKRQAGLPGWQRLELMEDLTFQLLQARIPELVLFRHERRLSEPQTASRFITQLIAQGQATEVPVQAVLHDLLGSAWQGPSWQIARTDLAGLREGILPTGMPPLLTKLSASGLRRWVHCPYQYTLQALGLQPAQLPQPFEDPMRQGEWLHKVIEIFFKGGSITAESGEWPDLNIGSAAWYQEAQRRLDALTNHYCPRSLEHDSLTVHLAAFSWPRLLGHLARLYQNAPAAALLQGEREFNLGATMMPVGSATRQLSGSIDSLDYIGELTVLTDFKRNHVPAEREVRQGLQAQLPFYYQAVVHAARPHLNLVAGYWSILAGEWTGIGVTESGRAAAIALGLVSEKTPSLAELSAAFQELFSWREADAQAEGRNYADATACGYCSQAELCRKADPGQAEAVALTTRLAARLEAMGR